MRNRQGSARVTIPQLRPYQTNLINASRAEYARGHRAVCAVLSTGGGKSLIIGAIAESLHRRKTPALIMVHRHELVMQLASALDRFQVPYGFVSPKYKPNQEPIQIASVQTLANRIKNGLAPEFEFIIADECAHIRARSWLSVIAHYPKAKLLGLTATPQRLDNKGLGEVFDAMVIGPTTRQLIDRGFLCDHRTFLPPSSETLRTQLESVDLVRGDYDKKQIDDLMRKSAVVGDAVATYTRVCPREPAIAFCTDIQSATDTAKAFCKGGFKFEVISGHDSDIERKRKLDGLASGTIDGLTSVDLIGEGLDVPRVTAIIALRPTQSLALWLQQCGRALRPCTGKTHAIILDHVGNSFTHGLVDDERAWSLTVDTTKRNRTEVLAAIDRCSECLRAYAAAAQCPFCGHTEPVNSKPREIKRIEGELREIDRQEFERQRLEAQYNRKREEAKAQTYDELVTLARSRNYADPAGWAYYRHNARKGRKGYGT